MARLPDIIYTLLVLRYCLLYNYCRTYRLDGRGYGNSELVVLCECLHVYHSNMLMTGSDLGLIKLTMFWYQIAMT